MVPLACYSNTILASNFGTEFLKMLPLLLALIVLLIFSAFFSSCETALSSVNVIRLKNMVEEKKKGARKALYLAEKFDVILVTLLVGNNLVNIGATTIAAVIFGKLIANPTVANLVNTLGMTVIVLIFGEITPKSYAKENPEKVCLRFSGTLYVIHKILWPFTWIFYNIRKLVMKKAVKGNSPQVTEEELESIIETMEDEGVIENDDAELMQNALDINDTEVYQIMTPRVDVVAINVDDDIENIKKVFFEFQYSRIPVYDKDKDNMVGILRERDFFTAYLNSPDHKFNVRSIMSTPYFVSKTKKIDDLIREMQELKKHFAIVLDEYGGTSGIVTMEDALEELVGEIYDEYDDAPELDFNYKKITDNKYIVNPDMDLEDLFEELQLGKKPETNYRDLGGFIYELCEEPPFKGKVVKVESVYDNQEDLDNPIHKEYELSFTIDRVIKRRIKSLILEINEINIPEEKEESKEKDKEKDKDEKNNKDKQKDKDKEKDN